MPTQIPSGSKLAVTAPTPRRRAVGVPRMLKYNEGGPVSLSEWDRAMDPKRGWHGNIKNDNKLADPLGLKKKAAGLASPAAGGASPIASSGGEGGAELATDALDEIPMGSFAKGGMVRKRRKFAGPRRLGYADGGLVQKFGAEPLDPDAEREMKANEKRHELDLKRNQGDIEKE